MAAKYNKSVWPEECQHKGREVYGAPSCRFCEFSEDPGLADGGCILSNDPAFRAFMHRRREHILERYGAPVKYVNRRRQRDYAIARARIKKMLERCSDFDTLRMLEDLENVKDDRKKRL